MSLEARQRFLTTKAACILKGLLISAEGVGITALDGA